MEDAADQLRRTRAFQGLVQGVRVGEGVQHRDPVAEFVLRVEPGDAQRGRVGDRLAQLHRRHAPAQTLQHGVHRGLGIVSQDHFGQFGRTIPRVAIRRRCQRAGQRLIRPTQDGGQVDGMAPGVSFLAARRRAQLADQARQHFVGVLPADVIQQFRGLVDEIRDVAAVQEHVVRGGAHHHVHQQRGVAVHGHGGQQAPRGAVRIAHFHEAAEPALQLFERQVLRIQGLQVEPRRLSVAVPGDVRQALV